MDYKYTVEVVDTTNSRIRVKYTSMGRADVRKNLRCNDFTAVSVDELINTNCPIDLWDLEENPPPVDPEVVEGAELDTTYRPPVEQPPYVPTPEEVYQEDMRVIAADRYFREASGIVWTDSVGDDFFFDTTVPSQNRHSAAQTRINQSARGDGGVWKCFAVDQVGGKTLKYRPMTNDDLSDVNDIIADHVEKCFDAESNTVDRYDDGDTDATFEEEWAKLP